MSWFRGESIATRCRIDRLSRLKAGRTLKLDRQVGSADKAGLWEFHRSESSYNLPGGRTFRIAAIKPAEPKAAGQAVDVCIFDRMEPEEK